jgi:hypothetical protein
MGAVETKMDPSKVEAFFGKVVQDVGATLHAGLVLIGDRLGLYRAMAGAGGLTPAELAKRTGTHERYVREWLSAQAAGGYVSYEATTGRFTLPAEHAFVLLDADLPGAFLLGVGSVRDESKIADAFPSGAGVGWHEHDSGVFEGCERFFRPGYAMNLAVSQRLPGATPSWGGPRPPKRGNAHAREVEWHRPVDPGGVRSRRARLRRDAARQLRHDDGGSR